MNNKFGKADPLEGHLCGPSAFGIGILCWLKPQRYYAKLFTLNFNCDNYPIKVLNNFAPDTPCPVSTKHCKCINFVVFKKEPDNIIILPVWFFL